MEMPEQQPQQPPGQEDVVDLCSSSQEVIQEVIDLCSDSDDNSRIQPTCRFQQAAKLLQRCVRKFLAARRTVDAKCAVVMQPQLKRPRRMRQRGLPANMPFDDLKFLCFGHGADKAGKIYVQYFSSGVHAGAEWISIPRLFQDDDTRRCRLALLKAFLESLLATQPAAADAITGWLAKLKSYFKFGFLHDDTENEEGSESSEPEDDFVEPPCGSALAVEEVTGPHPTRMSVYVCAHRCWQQAENSYPIKYAVLFENGSRRWMTRAQLAQAPGGQAAFDAFQATLSQHEQPQQHHPRAQHPQWSALLCGPQNWATATDQARLANAGVPPPLTIGNGLELRWVPALGGWGVFTTREVQQFEWTYFDGFVVWPLELPNHAQYGPHICAMQTGGRLLVGPRAAPNVSAHELNTAARGIGAGSFVNSSYDNPSRSNCVRASRTWKLKIMDQICGGGAHYRSLECSEAAVWLDVVALKVTKLLPSGTQLYWKYQISEYM